MQQKNVLRIEKLLIDWTTCPLISPHLHFLGEEKLATQLIVCITKLLHGFGNIKRSLFYLLNLIELEHVQIINISGHHQKVKKIDMLLSTSFSCCFSKREYVWCVSTEAAQCPVWNTINQCFIILYQNNHAHL